MQSTRQRQNAGANMRSSQHSPGHGSSTTGNYRARNDSAQFTPDSHASINQQSTQAPWTAASTGYIPEKIVLDADYIAKLERLVHDPVKLEAHGYIMRQLSRKEIEEKGHRCGRCGKKMKERKEKPDHSNLPWKKRSGDEKLQQENDTGEAILAPNLSAAVAKLDLNGPEDAKVNPSGAEGKKDQKPKEPICKFHPGSVFHGVSDTTKMYQTTSDSHSTRHGHAATVDLVARPAPDTTTTTRSSKTPPPSAAIGPSITPRLPLPASISNTASR